MKIQRRHLGRPSAWTAFGQRVSWAARARLEREPNVELSWFIPDEVRAGVRILWPATYSSPNADRWLEPLRYGLAGIVSLERSAIQQEVGNIAHVIFCHSGRSLRIGIDYDDLSRLHASARSLDLYFKMQYLRGGYEYSHVVPGGYVSDKLALYSHAAQWRRLRAARASRYDVFGRFGLQNAFELRSELLHRLQEQRQFTFEGGPTRTTWWEHMTDACRSKVCIDAPGRGELCFRLVEYLGSGACIVGPELENELHVPLRPGVHHVRVKRDLSDLVEVCQALVVDDERRRRLRQEAADYFDRYLSPRQLASYYVTQCLDVLTAKASR